MEETYVMMIITECTSPGIVGMLKRGDCDRLDMLHAL